MDHAILSASGAYIWTACSLSARFAQGKPDTAGIDAQMGTLAHAISEWTLRGILGMNSSKFVKATLAKLKSDPMYDTEMSRYVQGFVTYVMERYSEALRIDPKAKIYIESRLDLSRYIPEGFCTADIIIVYSGNMLGIDLKYGKRQVEAHNNKQLMIYALGAAIMFDREYDFDWFTMTIYQPRLDIIDSMEMSREALIDWANTFLKPKAKLAWEGKGDFVTGSHCTFCKALATCPAAKAKVMTLTKWKFAAHEYLTDEAVAESFQLAELVAAWVSETKKYALAEAVKGKKWPGLKLVNGRSNRVYKDEAKVVSRLIKKGYSESQLFNKKIIGITDMTTLLGVNFDKYLEGLIEKPPGSPTLVLESDKREKFSKVKGKFKQLN